MDESPDETIQRLTAERDALRQHILDIDAHATPYGDIPDEPGWVGTYLVTAGALHRALGKIGHSAPSCQAEEQVEALSEYLDAQRALWAQAQEGIKRTVFENQQLRARVAELERREAT